MKNDKLLVPNMFSVLIFKHIFSNLPPDYIGSTDIVFLFHKISSLVGCYDIKMVEIKNGITAKTVQIFKENFYRNVL